MSDSLVAVVMPKWGLEMVEGTITEWLVKVGDPISFEQDLVDIETSKIVNTLTSHQSGTLVRILAQEGELLDVGTPIAIIAIKETTESEVDKYVAEINDGVVSLATTYSEKPSSQEGISDQISRANSDSTADVSPAEIDDKIDFVIPKSLQGYDNTDATSATPVALRVAKQHNVAIDSIAATGRHERVTLDDIRTAVIAAGGRFKIAQKASYKTSSDGRAADDSDVPATPIARRLAKKLGVSLNDCRRTGRHQRVSKADVELAAFKLAPTPDLSAPAAKAPEVKEEAPLEAKPLSGMRRTIAKRLQESKLEAPHFRACIDVELDALLSLRKQLNDSRTDANISINDCFIKATAMALSATPKVNIQFDGKNVTSMPHADIAVAVALEDGLITPIVSKAETKGLVEISNEMRELATRAKIGKLKPAEFQGGSFSLSNLGMFGVSQFDAIINPPQAAILAIGASERRLLPDGDSDMRQATILTLTLSSDHRVIDGAIAAKFLQTLKTFIDQPAMMLG
ncbi:MAG: diaminohydroxyphosphoribosylaminopyrimidine deaminase [Porticoccaceae bacterium]|nr:diaminohydroxyphosphoribosylaminopyrimidine deaminase [Porticoccaceae bacterium]